MELSTPHFSHPSQFQMPGNFQHKMFGRKEAQTVSHNLTFYPFILLAICFAFWKSHPQAIKNILIARYWLFQKPKRVANKKN
jgi:hypothetical protein